MVGQGGGLAGFDFLQTSQMELVGVPCQPAGLAQPERADSVERELVLVPAELVCLGHREPSEVVERQPAADVAAQFGGRGVGDPHELVEVEVAAVAGEWLARPLGGEYEYELLLLLLRLPWLLPCRACCCCWCWHRLRCRFCSYFNCRRCRCFCYCYYSNYRLLLFQLSSLSLFFAIIEVVAVVG